MLLRFEPFTTALHPSFWQELATVKIDRLQLSDEPIDIYARYETGRVILDRQTSTAVSLGCALTLDASSFRDAASSSRVRAHGTLKIFNTIEDFKTADKQALFDAELQRIWNDVVASECPDTALTRFILLTFADLKKSRFVYWAGYPALISDPAWVLDSQWSPVVERLNETEIKAVRDFVSLGAAFFLLRRDEDGTACLANIADFATFYETVGHDNRIVGFVDPSGAPQLPGWPLRNLLSFLHARFEVTAISVICWKDELEVASAPQRSMISNVRLPVHGASAGQTLCVNGRATQLSCKSNDNSAPTGLGWERNAHNKLTPKIADLGSIMDPRKLADQAVDLNLKLMRWRIMPEIRLEKIQETKCLLLGAGTLGCYVARTLLGWGVRHITFVDSSTVSYSNPVRQPLFDFEDCLNGGQPKAQCAAAKLAKIYPGVTARGVQLSVPMPGHPVPSSSIDQVHESVRILEALFDEHDVVYLLMDSRESRWLPTLLGAAKGKLVINAALGFDSYLVMRHGALPSEDPKQSWHGRLGCYFCNDVVAPADSLTDRTLDQMCTVTRPGIAAIAGASAVELMVSVLQHPLGVHAPASTGESPNGNDTADAATKAASTVLGIVPHQLRGFLAQFNNLRIIGQAYDRCTGCSLSVVNAYFSDGFDMLIRAFNDEHFLERLTGLDKMYQEVEDMEAVLDWDDDEDEALGA